MGHQQQKIEQEIASAGFVKTKDPNYQYGTRTLYILKCSVEGCQEEQRRHWDAGRPPDPLIKQVKNSGWFCDKGKKPRCPTHYRQRTAELLAKHTGLSHESIDAGEAQQKSILIVPPAKPRTRMGEQLAAQLKAGSATDAVAAGALDQAATNYVETVSHDLKVIAHALVTAPISPPAPTIALVDPPISKETNMSNKEDARFRQFTKDIRDLQELIELFGGNQTEAAKAIGLSPTAVSNYLREREIPVTSNLAVKWALSQRKKAKAAEVTTIFRVPDEMQAAVKGIAEGHKGCVVSTNGLYVFCLLPGDKVQSVLNVVKMLPNCEIVGTVP